MMFGKVKVVEQYHHYAPPVDVLRSLRLLLGHVPEQHLSGLQKITLTNSENVREQIKGKMTLEKRRFRAADCRGLYRKGQIVLIVDRIFQYTPGIVLLVPPLKTFLLGEVLYHEIGHHIHRIEEPGYRNNKEAVADEWKEKLLQIFVRQRYRYLAGTLRLCDPLFPLILSRFKDGRPEGECDAPT